MLLKTIAFITVGTTNLCRKGQNRNIRCLGGDQTPILGQAVGDENQVGKRGRGRGGEGKGRGREGEEKREKRKGSREGEGERKREEGKGIGKKGREGKKRKRMEG